MVETSTKAKGSARNTSLLKGRSCNRNTKRGNGKREFGRFDHTVVMKRGTLKPAQTTPNQGSSRQMEAQTRKIQNWQEHKKGKKTQHS